LDELERLSREEREGEMVGVMADLLAGQGSLQRGWWSAVVRTGGELVKRRRPSLNATSRQSEIPL
jgi:hypothetical protein